MKNTMEQEQCLAFFSQRQSLRISAYAGSGKTSTLKLLASSTLRQGQYVAFNKAIADEARSRFPQTVNCRTSHSLAFTHVQKHYGFSSEKLNNTANAHKIAEMLHLPASLQVSRRHTMLQTSYGALLGEACKRFLHSTEETPSIKHFPRAHGVLSSYSDEEFQELASIAPVPVQELWSLMCNPESRLPIGHDGYLKLWALSHPELPVDYIMLDEAQDSNPAILKVLAAQPCQVVYVGDPYQQIYEWRGAIDAMSRVETPHQALLSQSFRFGPHIANAATKVIRVLGATSSVIGNPALESHLAEVFPDAILCRGNAGVMGSMLALLSNNVRCHVLGGTQELQSLLNDVSRLKRG